MIIFNHCLVPPGLGVDEGIAATRHASSMEQNLWKNGFRTSLLPGVRQHRHGQAAQPAEHVWNNWIPKIYLSTQKQSKEKEDDDSARSFRGNHCVPSHKVVWIAARVLVALHLVRLHDVGVAAYLGLLLPPLLLLLLLLLLSFEGLLFVFSLRPIPRLLRCSKNKTINYVTK